MKRKKELTGIQIKKSIRDELKKYSEANHLKLSGLLEMIVMDFLNKKKILG
jgi:hypothetical protein